MKRATPKPHSALRGYASGFRTLAAALAVLAVPAPPISVGDWAAQYRVVAAESGSPYPGKWNRDLVPYAREIEDCLSFDHGATDVTVMKSAQVGVSEIAINLLFSIIHSNRCPFLVLVPTTDEVRRWNKIKFQANIDATPAMRGAIVDQKSRDADSSTASVKRFRGGFGVVTGANSSVGLQMLSAKVIIFEEVSGYPEDAGGRGDPVGQAIARCKAWEKRKPKRFFISTPEMMGTCRITARYDQSDQRRRYLACPHCGTWQTLHWNKGESGLRWKSDRVPHEAFYECGANGCVIEPWDLRGMDRGGIWLKTYRDVDRDADGREVESPDNPAPPPLIEARDIARWIAARGPDSPSHGRQPGFAIWQAYSPFATWDAIVAEYLAARAAGPAKLKVFTQQTLGEAWEERGEAPPAERLLEVRENFPSRRVPPQALFVTGMADVQGNRLEWAVWAWAADLQSWLIDHGVIEGDPEGDAPWSQLSGIIDRQYEDAWGKPWDIDAFGVDSGFLSNRIYRFVRLHLKTERDTRQVFALDGRPGWKLPPIGTPRAIDIDYEGRKIGAVMNWPVGTFDMKAEIYAGLRARLKGADADGRFAPGTIHVNQRVDRFYLEQLTAEFLEDVRHKSSGVMTKIWTLPNNRRNEALDIAVGARALAHHLSDGLTAAQWQNLAARRRGAAEDVQLDLARLWAPGLKSESAPPEAAPSRADTPHAIEAPAPNPAPQAMDAAPANAVRAAENASPAADPARGEPRRGRRVIASPYLH